MGFQLVQKLKLSKKLLNVWKKETFGIVEDQMANFLYDMKLIVVKDENEGLDEEEVQHLRYLLEEFRQKTHQEEIKWKQ